MKRSNDDGKTQSSNETRNQAHEARTETRQPWLWRSSEPSQAAKPMTDSGAVQSRIYHLGDGLSVTYKLGLGSKMDPEAPGMYGTQYALLCEFSPCSDGEISQLTEHQARQVQAAHQDMLKQFAVRAGLPYETLRVLSWAGDHCEGCPEFPACRLANQKFRSDDSNSLTTWNPHEAARWASEMDHSVMRCALIVGHVDGTPRALCQRCLASVNHQTYPVRRRKAA